MASTQGLNFEKAMEYMGSMEVTDYLQKTLDFLQRNNNELYFPSISPHVEAFLVNMVCDPRNLSSKSFKYENKKLASDIIEVLEMSKDVFRWTHSYERGNILVYKKIFTSKIKQKPAKASSIAHRLHQAQHPGNSSTHDPNAPITKHADPDQLDFPVTTTRFKLRFLSKTLRFIKNETEFTLEYEEMPRDQAEYIFSLIKYKDKDVGFGYKSLYAPLWEAMEEYGVDYKFEVKLEKTSSKDAIVTLKKTPKTNKTKQDRTAERDDITKPNNTNEPKKDEKKINISTKNKQDCSKQNQPFSTATSEFPPLELLQNIAERFFRDSVATLTEFADDESRASVVFYQLSEEEITFVKRVKTLAESPKVREMFSPQYRDLLCRLDNSIKQVMKTCKFTTTVNEKDRSITLKKTPRFATPLPVAQRSVAIAARSKSLALVKTRDRSISRDRMIQFQKGGKLPATGNAESTTENVTNENQEERGRSRNGMSKRTAKLLEDLSTPVESDRGIRMMLLMGWNGGALGARGDGIMEPVMPKIDLPTRGGLGHVPPPKPPKVIPRKPLDFRLTFLHSLYDLLLHEANSKVIQFKDPLVKKETKFIRASLVTLNKRRPLSLTKQELDLVHLVLRELAGRPGLAVRLELSEDLKIVTLHKDTNQPVKAPKPSAPKPSAPKPKPAKSGVITITDDDADVTITIADVNSVMPYVDVNDMPMPADPKAIRKRAARLLFLTKLAELLYSGFQSKIVFNFDFSMSKKLVTFIYTVVDGLNDGHWNSDLLGGEAQIYADLRAMARGSMFTAELLANGTFIITKTPLIDESRLINAPNQRENNNDEKLDNHNKKADVNDCTKQMDIDKISSKEGNITVVVNTNENQRLVQAIEKSTNNIKDATINKTDDRTTLYNETDDSEVTSIDNECANSITNNRTGYISVKNVDFINAEFDIYKSIQNEKMEEVDMKTETFCDNEETNVKESDLVIKSEGNNEGVTEIATEFSNIPELSDFDRDIQELQMTIMEANLNCFVMKEENNAHCDLEVANSETDLNINTNKEMDIDCLNAKRSHSSSVCSEELDTKKIKIITENDEQIVIVLPKNSDEKIEEIVKKVQTVMAKEIDKAGGFLPLLKCHGVQNNSLIYSCHDEDDVVWLKNVVSAANLDVEIIIDDHSVLGKKRELLIMVNSYIPLDVKTIFRKFEVYNVGLNTKYWKVTYKHTDATFIMFKVIVDERSFKFISQEKFSLYCGIDKAQFSII